MKKIWSKKSAVGLLLVTNAISAAYIFAKESNFWALKSPGQPHSVASVQGGSAASAKKGLVQGASLSQSGELQGCYEAFLAKEPKIDEGIVVVLWVVGKKGKVSDIKLMQSDLQDEVFTNCLMNKLNKMSLASPSNVPGTIVSHKFNFHRKTPANVAFQ